MSFDLYYTPCHISVTPKQIRNPFTKKMEAVALPELTGDEVDAVREVLSKSGFDADADRGDVKFPDSGYAEIYAKDLQNGCMVALRGGVTSDVIQFLFDLLLACNWVVMPSTDNPPAIATSMNAVVGVPADFPKVTLCSSPQEMWQLIDKGFKDWNHFRMKLADQSLADEAGA